MMYVWKIVIQFIDRRRRRGLDDCQIKDVPRYFHELIPKFEVARNFEKVQRLSNVNFSVKFRNFHTIELIKNIFLEQVGWRKWSVKMKQVKDKIENNFFDDRVLCFDKKINYRRSF